jgi:hypothetical protein
VVTSEPLCNLDESLRTWGALAQSGEDALGEAEHPGRGDVVPNGQWIHAMASFLHGRSFPMVAVVSTALATTLGGVELQGFRQ